MLQICGQNDCSVAHHFGSQRSGKCGTNNLYVDVYRDCLLAASFQKLLFPVTVRAAFFQTMKHMSKQVRHFIQKITKLDQDYYPEHLGNMIIVNAPTAFKAMWSLVKPCLDKRTQKKIEVHGGNFSHKLLELVDRENLPTFLGGSCSCFGGCENSDAGPWNDPQYQLPVHGDAFESPADPQKLPA